MPWLLAGYIFGLVTGLEEGGEAANCPSFLLAFAPQVEAEGNSRWNTGRVAWGGGGSEPQELGMEEHPEETRQGKGCPRFLDLVAVATT